MRRSKYKAEAITTVTSRTVVLMTAVLADMVVVRGRRRAVDVVGAFRRRGRATGV